VKRDPALVTLSHDHHLALSAAQTLKRATADTASVARAAFVAYWEEHGRGHFRLEEEILLPAYAPYGDPHHPLVARALCDHVDIRARADALAVDATLDPAVLHELGRRLADHVRLEERQLFALIESVLPAARLATVAAALEHAEPCAAHAQGFQPDRDVQQPGQDAARARGTWRVARLNSCRPDGHTRSCLLVRGSRLAPTQRLQQAPRRDQRPDPLQQQEAKLLLVPGEDRKDRGAGQVEDQIEARALIEHPELGRRVSGQDQQGADNLDHLVDGPFYEDR
jgi:hypothetical protein